MADHSTPNWVEIRERVKEFVETKIYPLEPELDHGTRTERNRLMAQLMDDAKAAGLWALGHPKDIGGQGMPFLDYVYVNEVIGRSFYAMQALGTLSLQDSLMLRKYAPESWKKANLHRLVAGEIIPSFAMTEPDIASSDPTQLQTRAVLDGDHWVLNGRKWFTTGAGDAEYTSVMVRTEPEGTPNHNAFSIIIVPTSTKGYNILRDTPLLGIEGGHWEVEYDNVRVPAENILGGLGGGRGAGFRIAQERLGPGRIYHCMRWLGQAQRGFDLMCRRLHERTAFGEKLADKQLMQQHVFESAAEIQAARLLTLSAARKIDSGDQAREEIGLIKVVGARMLQNVLDRAIQVFGAKGLTDDTPLSRMFRHAREGRIYDGPDEVHIQSVARRLLRRYRDDGPGIDFGAEDAALLTRNEGT